MPRAKTTPSAAAKPAAAVKAEAKKTASALGDMASMPENGATMHGGLHDGHDSEAHFSGQMHTDDFPENWQAPAQLEAPEPRPGMVQRWVRSSLIGKADAKNLSAQGRQGWRPRTLESVPEGDRKNYPTMKDPRTSGEFMVNGDLVLCEMPQRLFDQMSAHYRQKRVGQVEALVDSHLKEAAVAGSERHGIGAPYVAERKSKVTTARVPIVAAD